MLNLWIAQQGISYNNIEFRAIGYHSTAWYKLNQVSFSYTGDLITFIIGGLPFLVDLLVNYVSLPPTTGYQN